ncbi:hypothetical protein LRP88_09208 [Fusarium phalaenopsidis]
MGSLVMVVAGARVSVEEGDSEVLKGSRLRVDGGGEVVAVAAVAVAAVTAVGGSHVAAEAEGLAAAGNYAVEAAEAAAFVGVVGLVDRFAAVADARVAAGMLAAVVAADSGMSAVDAGFGVEAADKAAAAAAAVVVYAGGLAAAVVDLVGDAAGLAAGIAGLAIDAAGEAAGTGLVAAAEDNEHHQVDSAELLAVPAADAHIDLPEPEDIDSIAGEDADVVDLAADESAGHSK